MNKHFADFYIAGFTYYNGVDVFENFKIGTYLNLKAEPENRFDPNAVAIYYKKEKIGFVPKTDNEMLSNFLNAGHTNLFEVKISQLAPINHPEKQIRVVVRIKSKKENQ